jgi:hypothetical protein
MRPERAKKYRDLSGASAPTSPTGASDAGSLTGVGSDALAEGNR